MTSNDRPTDTWRICGHAVQDRRADRGCDCPPHRGGADTVRAIRAERRLATDPHTIVPGPD